MRVKNKIDTDEYKSKDCVTEYTGTVHFEQDPLMKDEHLYERFCAKVLTDVWDINIESNKRGFMKLDCTNEPHSDCQKIPDLVHDEEDNPIALEVKMMSGNMQGGVGQALLYNEVGYNSGLVIPNTPDKEIEAMCIGQPIDLIIIHPNNVLGNSVEYGCYIKYSSIKDIGIDRNKEYRDIFQKQIIKEKNEEIDKLKDRIDRLEPEIMESDVVGDLIEYIDGEIDTTGAFQNRGGIYKSTWYLSDEEEEDKRKEIYRKIEDRLENTHLALDMLSRLIRKHNLLGSTSYNGTSEEMMEKLFEVSSRGYGIDHQTLQEINNMS